MTAPEPELCATCAGTGKAPCPDCHGAGSFGCPNGCHETGCPNWDCNDGEALCPDCDGVTA